MRSSQSHLFSRAEPALIPQPVLRARASAPDQLWAHPVNLLQSVNIFSNVIDVKFLFFEITWDFIWL